MVATRPDVVACGRVTHDLHSRGVRTLMRCCTAPPRLVPRTLHTQVALERRRTPASERTRVRYEPLQKIGLGFRFPAAWWREQKSVLTPQAARGWYHPPCGHFKSQSCCCLESAFEVAAFQTHVLEGVCC
jgi:hypothetical protein